jgi:hypothetical protein
MKRLVLLSLFFYPSFIFAEAYTLTHEQWSVPKSAEFILEIPAIRSTISEFNQAEQSRIRIRYPGGDTGNLWNDELISWLVALGVPKNRIESIPGTNERSIIKLEVVE